MVLSCIISEIRRDINWSKIAIVYTRPAFNDPVRGLHQNITITYVTDKPEWRGCYPMVKKFEDVFIWFGTIHERDRLTDGQTPHDGNGSACSLVGCSRTANASLLHIYSL